MRIDAGWRAPGASGRQEPDQQQREAKFGTSAAAWVRMKLVRRGSR
jgi:hypothetical protein